MSEERKQILTMLADGKINADEAERLLQKLGLEGGGEGGGHRRRHGHRRRKRLHLGSGAIPGEGPGSTATAEEDPAPSGAPKFLRVEIFSNDGDQVNVRVPLRLIRTGIKLTTMLPTETNAKLADKGIDLSELGKLEGEELVDALRELEVDVDSADGDTVRVFCE